MELIFTAIKWLFLGFFGLIGALILLAIVFGKRVKKEWDYEAEFRDADGREFAEFDIELSRIEKVEADYTVKPKFRMRHDALTAGSTVRVYLEDLLVLEGTVTKAGRVWLRKDDVRNSPESAAVGQVCRVELSSGETFSAELKLD